MASPQQGESCQEGEEGPLTAPRILTAADGPQPGVGVQTVGVQVDDIAGVTQTCLVPGERPHMVVSVGLQPLQVVDTARLWNYSEYL